MTLACAFCGNTTWLMFTLAPAIRNAIGGADGERVCCHRCWKDRKYGEQRKAE